jgi:hypothetical protein
MCLYQINLTVIAYFFIVLQPCIGGASSGLHLARVLICHVGIADGRKLSSVLLGAVTNDATLIKIGYLI